MHPAAGALIIFVMNCGRCALRYARQVDTCPDQSANWAKLEQRRGDEDQRHLQVQFGEDDKKNGENEAPEGKSGSEARYDMLQEPSHDRALFILCVIEHHSKQHGRAAPRMVKLYTVLFAGKEQLNDEAG
jgi:hypothetical protein